MEKKESTSVFSSFQKILLNFLTVEKPPCKDSKACFNENFTMIYVAFTKAKKKNKLITFLITDAVNTFSW